MNSENEPKPPLQLDYLKKLAMESVLSEQQAMDLIQGKLLDAWFVKIRLDIENKTGIIICLISKFKQEVLQVYSVFSNSPVIHRIRTFEDYKQILNDMLEATKTGVLDKTTSETLGRVIYRALSKEALSNLLPEWDKKRTESINPVLEEALFRDMKTKNIILQIEMDLISSVKFKTENVLDGVIKPISNPFLEQSFVPTNNATSNTSNKTQEIEKSALDIEIETIEGGFSRVVNCKTVLAPVAGIEFSKLKKDQKLLFQLPFKTPQDKETARRLEAVNSKGELQPIVGEFIKIVEGPKNEYYIFARGPYGVLLKAFEERPVRIAVPKEERDSLREDEKGFNIILYSVAFAIILVVFLIIMYFNSNP